MESATLTAPEHVAATGEALLRLSGVEKTYYDTRSVGGSVKETMLALLERAPHGPRIEALVDINIEVRPGESLGIIGANGSGKSTLLKIMAGIVQPSAGTVETRGRVVGMLELTAGFHPELTGEENVRLQGAVYGMRADDISRSMDSIFEFAGIPDFRRTPLKFYSSGMIARLGFSIASQCEPDVLLVDEVMAVGDPDFQTSCLDRMAALRRRGVAIVFVTHGMDLAERVCERIVWLRQGRIAAQGPASEVIAAYQREVLEKLYGQSEGKLTQALVMRGLPGRFGTGQARMEAVRVVDAEGRERRNFTPGEPFGIEIEFSAQPDVTELECSVTVDYECGLTLATWSAEQSGKVYRPEAGRGVIRLKFDAPEFQPGGYNFTPAITPVGGGNDHYDLHFRLHRFTIVDPTGAAPAVPLLLKGELRSQ